MRSELFSLDKDHQTHSVSKFQEKHLSEDMEFDNWKSAFIEHVVIK